MGPMRVFFDGKNGGRLIAVADDGSKFEQVFEYCPLCHDSAKVLTPIGAASPSLKRCGCSNQNIH